MSVVELDSWAPQAMKAPASAAVYQRVRLRMRNLQGLRKIGQEHENPKSLLDPTSDEVRKLDERHFSTPLHHSRLQAMTDDEVVRQAVEARNWLFDVLACHDKLLNRERQLRMFRLAVEKEMAGRQEDWSEMESLYMALTDCELASPEERLKSGFALVLHLNLAEGLKDVSKLASIRTDRSQLASTRDADADQICEKIFERAHSIKVDHFACAIPLSLLAPSTSTSIVDDNAGCCPICQNSYTALSTFSIEDLLADYPVRIKHCGHIIGKACLEQWMSTPKIDEAKYPHRTCPMCRVKIEGVKAPKLPDMLRQHIKTDRRAMETVQELVYGWDMEVEQCYRAIVACMSEEIACKELMAEIQCNKNDRDEHAFAREEKVLNGKIEELRKEKWAWGFRGDGVWGKMKDEWMRSGVVRKG